MGTAGHQAPLRLGLIAGWVLLLVVDAPLAAGLGASQRTDPVNYLPAGAQSTALLHELAATPAATCPPRWSSTPAPAV